MDKIRIAVIDQYVLLNMWEDTALLPGGEMADSLSATLGSFPNLQIICDTRDVSENTSDIHEFMKALELYSPIVIDHEQNRAWVQYTFGERVKFTPVDKRTLPIDYKTLDITPFVPSAYSGPI